MGVSSRPLFPARRRRTHTPARPTHTHARTHTLPRPTSSMSDAERQQEAKDAFAIYAEGSGSLNASQCITALRSLGLNVSQAAFNQKAGGSTDLNTFISLSQQFQPPSEDDNTELFESFRAFDKTGAGVLSAKELAHMTTILGDKFNQQEVDALMSEAIDGKIDYERLIKKMSPSA